MDDGSGTSSIYDSSGNNNSGNLIGSMLDSSWVIGKYGDALDFDGADDSVEITNTTLIDTTRPFKISAWINMDTWGEGGNFGEIFERNGYLLLEVDDNNDSLVLYNSSNASGAETTSGALSLNMWHYVTAVYNGDNTANLFVNGIDKTSDNSITATNSNGNSYIGGSGSENFDGRIDDVRIYNYARTSKQIIEDMNAGHPLVGTPNRRSCSTLEF
ncbi:MAG: hypothetical protein KatS3mg087_1001 [Patescibacteria group bacterium]|nr:MAG: hypothetical protein KatS3mg087_1001 [Patescibacteria group bacterium]